jgi:hypothetical protein
MDRSVSSLSMADFVGWVSARRWPLPVLVLLLVLGHACELPAYADLIGTSHAAEESHNAGDGHHGGEPALSCEPASATSIPGQPQVVAPEFFVVSPVDDPAPARKVARSFEGPLKFAVRTPLFLLHASLLI